MSRRLSGTSPLTISDRKPFGNGGFSDARLADQNRVVFCAPREHLNGAANLLIAADHGIELALGRRIGEIAGVTLQRIISLLSRGAVRRAPLAQLVYGCVQTRRRNASFRQDLRGVGIFLHRHREEQPFDGDIAVACLLGDLLGLIENLGQLGRDINLSGAAARHLRHLGKRLLDVGQRIAGTSARTRDQPRGQPFAIIQQNFEEMLRRQALMAFTQCKRLSGLKEALGPIGQFLEIHCRLNGRGAWPPIRV